MQLDALSSIAMKFDMCRLLTIVLNMRSHRTCRKAKTEKLCNKQCDPTDPRYACVSYTPNQSLAVVRLIQDTGRTEHTNTARPAPASPQSDILNLG